MATYSGVSYSYTIPDSPFKRGITNIGLVTVQLSYGITWPRRYR